MTTQKHTRQSSRTALGTAGLLSVLAATCAWTHITLGVVTGGWADVNGTVTGGAGGPTVTVTTAADFNNYISQTGPYIIQVSGSINLGTPQAQCKSDKTIVGLGTNANLIGNLTFSGVSNCMVTNITFTNPSNLGQGDGI